MFQILSLHGMIINVDMQLEKKENKIVIVDCYPILASLGHEMSVSVAR
jgi:hypothetical protein